MQKDNAKRIALAVIAGCLLVGFLGYFAYSEHAERERAKKVVAELVGIVKNELKEFQLPGPGKFIYQQVETNYHCNYAALAVVYASDMNEKEICATALASLPRQKWVPQHRQQKTDFCEPRPVSTELFAHNQNRTKFLTLGAYPKAAVAAHTFMPVNIYAELAIKKEAIKYGESFYYVELSYQGPYDEAQCPCNVNRGGTVCEFANATFYESNYSELIKSDHASPKP